MAIPTPITFEDDKAGKQEKVYNFDHGKVLDLTPEAVAQVKTFMQSNPEKTQGKKFRVYVEGGGCSGMQYGFTFDDVKEGDHQIECDDITVLVNVSSETFLKGSVVDYVNDLNGAGFIVKNPQSKGECGCGISFSV